MESTAVNPIADERAEEMFKQTLEEIILWKKHCYEWWIVLHFDQFKRTRRPRILFKWSQNDYTSSEISGASSILVNNHKSLSESWRKKIPQWRNRTASQSEKIFMKAFQKSINRNLLFRNIAHALLQWIKRRHNWQWWREGFLNWQRKIKSNKSCTALIQWEKDRCS